MNPVFVLVLAFICSMAATPAIARSGTVFTYQGELMSGGNPANGAHDMEFRLWNAASGGAQVGASILRNDVAVSEGLFTVELDFGAAAFDNASRWLEVKVNGFTLDPRTRITRSPYSLQTRGIFVDDAENVGIGTTSPQSKLHVAGNMMADGHLYSLNPSNAAAVAFLGWGVDSAGDDMARIRIGGSGAGASNGLDIQRTGDRSLMRIHHNGSVGIGTTEPGSLLDVAGDGNFAGPLGVGGPSSLFGQLTVVDSGHGLPFAIDAEWSSSSFPTIFASNTGSGGVLWAQGNSDVSLSGGGTIVTGSLGGANIGIDNNEIMARNAGDPSTLYLNADGGDVVFGANRIHPAYAYGTVGSDGVIENASSNVVSVSRSATGTYDIRLTDPIYMTTDVVIATCRNSGIANPERELGCRQDLHAGLRWRPGQPRLLLRDLPSLTALQRSRGAIGPGRTRMIRQADVNQGTGGHSMNRTFVPALIAISGMIGAGAEAQSSTVFTYQGELTSAGDPANGAHDMQFSLWNALSGGGQFGGTLTRDDVVVTEGLFSVQLDFGAGAFDNANRWLEIRVNGFTLAPRTMITRSPYSIQTRGIFVDDAENVGIGTTAPASKLHVGGDVMANGNVYSLNPNNPGAVAFLGWGSDSAGDDVARIRIGGEGPGATNGLDIQRTADRSLMRIQNNGSVGIGTSEPGALLDVAGDGNFAGPLGVGGPSSLFGELTVVDSGHGLPFAIDAEWSHNSFPTIFASNSGSGGVLWAQGNSDVALAGGGTIVTGDLGGANIGIDNNEIMARNAGSPAPLFLNAEGGDVNFGTHRIHPAHAYAKIRSNGTIVSRSPNVTGASWSEFDALFVTIEGGVLASDIIIASDAHANSAAYTIAASAESGQVRIQCYHPSFGWGAHDVQFVIYRP